MRKREIIRDRRKSVSIDSVSAEIIERYVQTCQCPYCRDGHVYKMLPLHIYQIHGISAYEFRKEYGFNRGHRLSSHETSEAMSLSIKKRGGANKAWLEYDRHKSIVHRYEDGGQREEAIKNKQAIATTPEAKLRFYKSMSAVDRKAVATKMSPEVKSAKSRKGALILWERQSLTQRKETIRRIQDARTPESEKRRSAHAALTMKTFYFSDPVWRDKRRKRITEGMQAKVPRSDYASISKLYENGVSQGKIASQYGVSKSLIHLIIKCHKLGLPTLPHA